MNTIDLTGSAGIMTEQGVMRMNRSTDGVRTLWFHPDWRFRQATVYLNFYDHITARGGHFSLPEWEDDDYVINLFSFMVSQKCQTPRMTELFYMSSQASSNNDVHGISSRIKALTAGGLSAEEVGEELMIDPDVVTVHLACFFDVKSILGNDERMSSVLHPFNPQVMKRNSGSELRESLWIMAAWIGGPELYRSFSRFTVDASIQNQERVSSIIHNLFSAKSLEFAMSSRIDGIPRAADFDKFIAISEVASRNTMAKAALEAVSNEQKRSDNTSTWHAFVSNVGVDVAGSPASAVGDDQIVTGMSISELRRREATSDKVTAKDRKTRILDIESGLGVTEYR